MHIHNKNRSYQFLYDILIYFQIPLILLQVYLWCVWLEGFQKEEEGEERNRRKRVKFPLFDQREKQERKIEYCHTRGKTHQNSKKKFHPPTGRKIDVKGGFNFLFQSCPSPVLPSCFATTTCPAFLPPHAAVAFLPVLLLPLQQRETSRMEGGRRGKTRMHNIT